MIRSIPQLEALRDEWDGLAAAQRSPLLDHAWFLSCAEAFHSDAALRILTARRDGRLTGVAPLVRESSPVGHRVKLLGASRLFEPSDWLSATPDATADLVDQALALGQPLVLQRLPEGGPVIEALRNRPWRQALTVIRSTAPSLAVSTQGHWDDYYVGLSSQITTNLRRLRKKAEATLGALRVERLTPPPSDVDVLLESFIQVEGSGWKGRQGSSLGSRADLRDFFRRYGHRAAAHGHFHVVRLWFGTQLAAAELAVEAYGRMWQLKIGHHEAVGAYYPGLHLTAASIQSAFERGLEAYEFLGSAAPWEERWRPQLRRYQMAAVYPITGAGVVGACRDAVRVLWRRAYARGAAA